MYIIVPFFSSFTISFASPFPSPSCFLNSPQSSNWSNRLHNLLRLENFIATDPGFSSTSIPYLVLPRISLRRRLKTSCGMEGRSKPSRNVPCSSLNLNGEKLRFSRGSCFVLAWDIARRCCIWLSHEDRQTSLSQPLQLAYLALEMYCLNPLAYMHLKFVAQILISRGSVPLLLK